MGRGVLLDDLHGAGEAHRHRSQLDLDLGPDGVRPGLLEHGASVDARHQALEVEDRRVALVDRPCRGERMVQLYSHGAFSSSIVEWVISIASPPADRTLSKPL